MVPALGLLGFAVHDMKDEASLVPVDDASQLVDLLAGLLILLGAKGAISSYPVVKSHGLFTAFVKSTFASQVADSVVSIAVH